MADLAKTAKAIVEAFYSGFDDQGLTDMLEHGKAYPSGPEVDAMNAAIQDELERRKTLRETVR
jgi:hypothetical protein